MKETIKNISAVLLIISAFCLTFPNVIESEAISQPLMVTGIVLIGAAIIGFFVIRPKDPEVEEKKRKRKEKREKRKQKKTK